MNISWTKMRKNSSMKILWAKMISVLMAALLSFAWIAALPAHAAGEVSLYTQNKNITVSPGQSINYSIDIINHSNSIQDVKLAVQGMPEGWTYELTSGSWKIQEIAVQPNDSRNVSLEVNVPLQIEKGAYRFTVMAEGFAAMPLTLNISETGTFKTELTTEQPNMQGNAGSTFRFNLDLRNRTADNQLYALTADAPRGWEVIFNVDSKQVTSTSLEANAKQTVNMEVKPPEGVTEGTFKIPVVAASGSTSADTEVEVVITGKYDMRLTTPKGLLSANVTAGGTTKVELEIQNNGTTALKDVEMDYYAPVGWDVTFEPMTLDQIEPGESGKVIATIKSNGKAIPGDYITEITAKTPEVSSTAQFRIAVKTSMLWGWVGILIIAGVIGGIYYLFRKYGRR